MSQDALPYERKYTRSYSCKVNQVSSSSRSHQLPMTSSSARVLGLLQLLLLFSDSVLCGGWGHTHATVCMWKSNNSQESPSTLGSMDRALYDRLQGKCTSAHSQSPPPLEEKSLDGHSSMIELLPSIPKVLASSPTIEEWKEG